MTSTAPERFQPHLHLPQSHWGLLRGVVLSTAPLPPNSGNVQSDSGLTTCPGAQLASSSFPLKGEAETPVSEA